MRPTGILTAAAVLLIVFTVSSAAAGDPLPRGVLTAGEYREMLASQQAGGPLAPGTPAEQARSACQALTNLSGLTSTQHAACLAKFAFWDDLNHFGTGITNCGKKPTQPLKLRCFDHTTNGFSSSTEAYLRADSTATRAAAARGFTGKCLDHLALTHRQTTAMRRLASGLLAFSRALKAGQLSALISGAERVDADISDDLRLLVVTGSVTLCQHS